MAPFETSAPFQISAGKTDGIWQLEMTAIGPINTYVISELHRVWWKAVLFKHALYKAKLEAMT